MPFRLRYRHTPSPAAPAEILDRIAIAVGDRVITERQIVHEIRVAAFLNRETPEISSRNETGRGRTPYQTGADPARNGIHALPSSGKDRGRSA